MAIATGAARGIGAAMAARMARDGFTVAIGDDDLEGVPHTAGMTTTPIGETHVHL